MTRQKRTPEVLRDTSELVYYEYWMLNSLAQSLASGIFGESALNNAALESFTIHARVLLDFLYAQNPHLDDVIAEDYFDEPMQWRKVRSKKTATLNIVHLRVGKEVAHLSYERLDVTAEAKRWEFTQIANDINYTFSIFLRNVDEIRLALRYRVTDTGNKKTT